MILALILLGGVFATVMFLRHRPKDDLDVKFWGKPPSRWQRLTIRRRRPKRLRFPYGIPRHREGE